MVRCSEEFTSSEPLPRNQPKGKTNHSSRPSSRRAGKGLGGDGLLSRVQKEMGAFQGPGCRFCSRRLHWPAGWAEKSYLGRRRTGREQGPEKAGAGGAWTEMS